MEEKSIATHVLKCDELWCRGLQTPDAYISQNDEHSRSRRGFKRNQWLGMCQSVDQGDERTHHWIDTHMQHSELIKATTKNCWINWISLYLGSNRSFPLAIWTICYFCICQYSSFFLRNQSRLLWSLCVHVCCWILYKSKMKRKPGHL